MLSDTNDCRDMLFGYATPRIRRIPIGETLCPFSAEHTIARSLTFHCGGRYRPIHRPIKRTRFYDG